MLTARKRKEILPFRWRNSPSCQRNAGGRVVRGVVTPVKSLQNSSGTVGVLHPDGDVDVAFSWMTSSTAEPPCGKENTKIKLHVCCHPVTPCCDVSEILNALIYSDDAVL
ncbi:hypothetical protein NPIL_452151 [Nephila pilipes]|uniref:Uncharacterized protein n=1 Tax=Nephila pilipes TaxID=299642 RepID=A0A8X6QR93_NEPPI|nr:hypothetical protein NPIL_452151 [Nephila pilipes]